MKEYRPFIIINPSTEYKQIKPSRDLARIIDCYWISDTKEFSSGKTIIIPDNCVDLIYRFGKDGILTGKNFIGMMSRTDEFFPENGEKMFGIRFLPYTVRYFFNYDMAVFKDRSISFEDIDDFMPLLSQLNFISSFSNVMENIIRIEQIIRDNLHFTRNGVKSEIFEIINTVYENGLLLKAEQVASQKHYSLSHINRLFRTEVGISLKTFMRIDRFQRILRTMNETGERKYLEIALEYGFYDQSHFIKEFKYFLNEAPSKRMIDFYNTESKSTFKIVPEGE